MKYRIALFLLLLSQTIAAMAADLPDIVLFLSDDHGARDSGAYGNPDILTPHIDALAKQGMRFTRAFAATPLCSPSRCVIQTGLMPFHDGGHKFGTPIRRDIRTMPEYFQELGYYTAHFGKFHHGPRDRFPYERIDPDEKKAVAFIDAYDQEKPLLLIVCTHPPHTPWVENTEYDADVIRLPENFIDTPETRADRTKYYSDVTLMDSILGNVLSALDRRDMQDSLLIYTSDQGANWPFEKWCVYDGGLRVPLIVRWSDRVAEGRVTDAMVSLVDLLPTMLDAAGVNSIAANADNSELPDGFDRLDGRSFLAVAEGRTAMHREAVFGTHTGNDNGGPGTANHCPARTIRTDEYRYIQNLDHQQTFFTHIVGCKFGPHYLPFWDSWVERSKTDEMAAATVDRHLHRDLEELYDVVRDPLEQNNLAKDPEYSETVRALRQQLNRWRTEQDDPIAVR